MTAPNQNLISSHAPARPSPARRHLAAAISALLVGGVLVENVAAQDFPATIDLGTLDGSNGLKIDGEAAGDQSARSVSNAGDINGDGVDDLIIGTGLADPNGNNSGRSYVVFGRDAATQGGFTSPFQLSALDGTNGFKIDGESSSNFSGDSVSAAGDVNGDGLDDLIIGADGANRSYVVFGRTDGFSSPLQLSALDGTNGFKIDGESGQSGYSVSAAGDINGDGVADLIIGNPWASPNGFASGRSYVVFGRDVATQGGFTSPLQLSNLDGTNGFKLDGDMDDFSGSAVNTAGDINGDGVDDVIVGARWAPDGDQFGRYWVVFGRDVATQGGFSSPIQLSALDGANGFRLEGEAEMDGFGDISVSAAGDVNGDGISDLIIGASRADPNGIESAGRSYVVFGKTDEFTATLSLSALDGNNGFKLDGDAPYDESGGSVSNAGDINDDGIADLIIGERLGRSDKAGRSYVVFGRTTGFSSQIQLSQLNGTDGFKIDGEARSDNAGRPVSNAGDINGDGIDDLLIGATLADPNGDFSGRAYVIFGGVFDYIDLSLLPPVIEFDDDVTVGQISEAKDVTLENIGTGDLDIGSLSISGPNGGDFALDNDSCSSQTLAPAETCSFDVTVTASATGTRSAQVDIPSNAQSSPDPVPLTANGVQAVIGLLPSSVDFGDVDVGQVSAAQTVVLQNTGTGDLDIGNLSFSGLNTGDFALGDDTCSSQTLAPAETCSFDVTVTASATGTRSAQVDIPSNAQSSPDPVPLTANGVQAVIGLLPSSVDFGDVDVGQVSAAQTVVLQNTGTGDLDIGNLSFSGLNTGDFALGNDSCSSQTIAPAATCSFDVTLTPSATGTRSAQVDIPSNAPSSPNAVSLAGTGVQTPIVSLLPQTLDFGEVTAGESAVKILVIENMGNGTLAPGTVSIQGIHAVDFSVQVNNCAGMQLTAGQFCGVDVRFAPSAPGVRKAALRLESNAPTSPDIVDLRGTNDVIFADGFDG